jgi:hypothetical protein
MTAGSVKRGNPAVLIAGVVVAIVVVFLGVAWFAVTAATQVVAAAGTGGPPSQDEWITAYAKINGRLALWERRGRISDDLTGRFKEAWEIEQIEGPTIAHEHWTSLWSSLISQPVPGSSNALIGVEQDDQPTALFALMGRGADANEPKWDSDESYANALVWFVRGRTMQTAPEK